MGLKYKKTSSLPSGRGFIILILNLRYYILIITFGDSIANLATTILLLIIKKLWPRKLLV